MAVITGGRKIDFLQKFFMYLIIIDWLLLGFIVLRIQSLNIYYGSVVSALLVVYNSFLTHICFRRAKRRDDTHLIYPVIMGTVIASLLFLYFCIS